MPRGGGHIAIAPRIGFRLSRPMRIPPIGARIRVLPAGYYSFWLGGLEYFTIGGVYYRYIPGEQIYVVVEKPNETEKAVNQKFDHIKMRDGSVVEGVFAGATDSKVTVKIGDKNQDININDIVSIQFAAQIPDETKKKE
jgi:hypothetical protein